MQITCYLMSMHKMEQRLPSDKADPWMQTACLKHQFRHDICTGTYRRALQGISASCRSIAETQIIPPSGTSNDVSCAACASSTSLTKTGARKVIDGLCGHGQKLDRYRSSEPFKRLSCLGTCSLGIHAHSFMTCCDGWLYVQHVRLPPH